jgi:hypothetical protein
MSDTGEEHKQTYEHVSKIDEFCKIYEIPFFFLTHDQGYHAKTWPSLRHQWEKNNTIASVAFPKSCTDKLKIVPIYNFVADYVNKTYLYGMSTPVRKKSIYEFTARYGKIRVIIGIASGEEKRVADESKIPHKWMRECIERSYPLIDLGMGRKECQDYIKLMGHEVPLPSNCKLCPFLSKQEVLWLYRFLPEDFADWVQFEKNKINKDPERKNNLGVFGKKLLPEILEIAQDLYGHWSDDRLHEYKMSHGHCVMSKY